MDSGDTLIEVLIALVVIGITSVALLSAFWTSISASSEHKDQATLDSVLKQFVEQATNQLGRQTSTTLTTPINNGATGITTLNVNSIPRALANGDALQLFSNGVTQNVTANGAQPASATPATITVSTFTASSAFPVGSSVIFLKTPKFTPCATQMTYSGGGLSFPPVVTSQGTYSASVSSVSFWESNNTWGSSCTSTTTPSQQQLIVATATNSATGASKSVQFVVSDPAFNPAPPATPAFSGVFTDSVVTGIPSSFSVTATGSPTPALSASGQPSWVTLVDDGGGNGTLFFDAPGSASGNSFSFTLSATNSYNGGTTVTQTFVVTVAQGPSITSANNDTVPPAVPFSFTVTTTGTPKPSLSETGMPPWASFTDNGDGTATLAATLPVTGSYTFTIGAQNTAGSASQTFTLVVSTAVSPAFTTAASDTVPINQAFSFTISATGLPSPTITESGTLPNGVNFAGGTGSATLSGTPTVSGSFPITLTATNIGGTATQSFVLTVNPQSTPTISTPTNGSPSSNKKSKTFSMTVTGTGFQSGATVTFSGGVDNTSVTVIVVNSTKLTVAGTTTSNTGSYSFTVSNPDGGQTTSQSGAFVVTN